MNSSAAELLAEYNNYRIKENVRVIVFVLIVATFGTIGKSFALFFYKYRVKATSTSNLIKYLCANDLFASLFYAANLPVQLSHAVTFDNVVLCKTVHFFNQLSTGNSLILLLLIGTDRFLKVCITNPKWNFTRRTTRYWTLGALIMAMINAGGEFFVAEVKEVDIEYAGRNLTGYTCVRAHDGSLTFIFQIVDVTLVVSTMSVIVLLYSLILRKVAGAREKVQQHKVMRLQDLSESEAVFKSGKSLTSASTERDRLESATSTGFGQSHTTVLSLDASVLSDMCPNDLIASQTLPGKASSNLDSKCTSAEHVLRTDSASTFLGDGRSDSSNERSSHLTRKQAQNHVQGNTVNVNILTDEVLEPKLADSAETKVLINPTAESNDALRTNVGKINNKIQLHVSESKISTSATNVPNVSESDIITSAVKVSEEVHVSPDSIIFTIGQTSANHSTRKPQRQTRQTKGSTSNRNRGIECQMSIMVFVISLTSLVSFIPYFIYTFTEEQNTSNRHLESVSSRIFAYSFIVNSSLNPYIMGVFNREFRQFVRTCNIFRMFASRISQVRNHE